MSMRSALWHGEHRPTSAAICPGSMICHTALPDPALEAEPECRHASLRYRRASPYFTLHKRDNEPWATQGKAR